MCVLPSIRDPPLITFPYSTVDSVVNKLSPRIVPVFWYTMIWTLRKFAHRTKDVVRFYEQIGGVRVDDFTPILSPILKSILNAAFEQES